MTIQRKRNRKGRLSAVLLAGALAVTTCVNVPVTSQAAGTENTELRNPRVVMNYCDTVYFGSYWQEDTNGDGKVDQTDDKQPIRWRILWQNEDGTDAYVMADKVLDCQPYNKEATDVTWETCTLRKWLNDEFYNAAFTKEEQNAIIQQRLSFGYNSGNDTLDKVFLPSEEDMINESVGFSADYNYCDQARIGYATCYAKEQGVYTNGDMGRNCHWWLRSVAWGRASIVYSWGHVLDLDRIVDSDYIGVRPVLHLNLLSTYILEGEKEDISLKSASWDTVELGTYEGKPITWRVLQVSEEEVFLLANQILTYKAYMTDWSYIEEGTDKLLTWQESEIREWLNNEFYKMSFTQSEQNGIVKTIYQNENNPLYGTVGGENTFDYVTLLSLSDVAKKEYGFPSDYFCTNSARYAVDSEGEEGGWMLRTLGEINEYKTTPRWSSIVFSGGVDMYTWYVERNAGIRPALHFNLSAYPLKKTGTITAEAEVKLTDPDTSNTSVPKDNTSISDDEKDTGNTTEKSNDGQSATTEKPTNGQAVTTEKF